MLNLSSIEALLDEGGQITIGKMHPIESVAIAYDNHNSLAMLQSRPGESLQALLQRLDAAIALACNEDRFIDEIDS